MRIFVIRVFHTQNYPQREGDEELVKKLAAGTLISEPPK